MTDVVAFTSAADPVLALVQAAQVQSIVDPALAIRRPLRDLIAATLDAAGRSQHTRRAYATAIAQFVHFLDAERGEPAARWRPLVRKQVEIDNVLVLVDVDQDTGRQRSEYVYSDVPAGVLLLVDAGLLDSFAAYRRTQGDGNNTVVARVAAVRTFLAVAFRDGILTPEQAHNMGIQPYQARQERSQQPVGRRLTPAEVRQLRAAVAERTETVKGQRDLVILDFCLYLGLRAAEVAGLRMDDFQQDAGRWWVTIRGKRAKTRRIKVHDVAYQSLTAWCTVAELQQHSKQMVFCSINRGGHVTKRSISPTDVARVVADYGHRARLAPAHGQGRLGAHDLRRTCARNAHDNGAPLLLVQQMLGHADPKTTARYIGADQDPSQTAVDYVRY